MVWTEIVKYGVSLGLAGIIAVIVIILLFKYFEKKIENLDKSREEQLKQTELLFKQNNDLLKYVMDSNNKNIEDSEEKPEVTQ